MNKPAQWSVDRESKPEKTGIYLTDINGDYGFAVYDADLKIWGCTKTSARDAFLQPEYEFAEQQKIWAEVPADLCLGVFKELASALNESLQRIATECQVEGDRQILVDATAAMEAARVVL